MGRRSHLTAEWHNRSPLFFTYAKHIKAHANPTSRFYPSCMLAQAETSDLPRLMFLAVIPFRCFTGHSLVVELVSFWSVSGLGTINITLQCRRSLISVVKKKDDTWKALWNVAYAAYHVFLWHTDFNPLPLFPNSLAREVTISWSFTSRAHLAL